MVRTRSNPKSRAAMALGLLVLPFFMQGCDSGSSPTPPVTASSGKDAWEEADNGEVRDVRAGNTPTRTRSFSGLGDLDKVVFRGLDDSGKYVLKLVSSTPVRLVVDFRSAPLGVDSVVLRSPSDDVEVLVIPAEDLRGDSSWTLALVPAPPVVPDEAEGETPPVQQAETYLEGTFHSRKDLDTLDVSVDAGDSVVLSFRGDGRALLGMLSPPTDPVSFRYGTRARGPAGSTGTWCFLESTDSVALIAASRSVVRLVLAPTDTVSTGRYRLHIERWSPVRPSEHPLKRGAMDSSSFARPFRLSFAGADTVLQGLITPGDTDAVRLDESLGDSLDMTLFADFAGAELHWSTSATTGAGMSVGEPGNSIGSTWKVRAGSDRIVRLRGPGIANGTYRLTFRKLQPRS